MTADTYKPRRAMPAHETLADAINTYADRLDTYADRADGLGWHAGAHEDRRIAKELREITEGWEA